jgi:hypothetical protein
MVYDAEHAKYGGVLKRFFLNVNKIWGNSKKFQAKSQCIKVFFRDPILPLSKPTARRAKLATDAMMLFDEVNAFHVFAEDVFDQPLPRLLCCTPFHQVLPASPVAAAVTTCNPPRMMHAWCAFLTFLAIGLHVATEHTVKQRKHLGCC